MIGVHFDMAYANEVFQAMLEGRPIPPPHGGWTWDAKLTVAGIMVAAAAYYGPRNVSPWEEADSDLLRQHRQHREAIVQTLHNDVRAGVDFLADLSWSVLAGTYRERYGDEVMARISGSPSGRFKVLPVSGFKTD
jgi:hypothetical protein